MKSQPFFPIILSIFHIKSSWTRSWRLRMHEKESNNERTVEEFGYEIQRISIRVDRFKRQPCIGWIKFDSFRSQIHKKMSIIMQIRTRCFALWGHMPMIMPSSKWVKSNFPFWRFIWTTHCCKFYSCSLSQGYCSKFTLSKLGYKNSK